MHTRSIFIADQNTTIDQIEIKSSPTDRLTAKLDHPIHLTGGLVYEIRFLHDGKAITVEQVRHPFR